MNHQIIPPPKHLEAYVRYFWTIDFEDKSNNATYLKIFACRFPRLIFQHHNGKSALHIDGNSLPTTFLSGINTTPYTSKMDNCFSITGVSFYPQGIKAIFGIDAYEIVNDFPDLHHFIPKDLNERLKNAISHNERISILLNLLNKKLENQFKNEDLTVNHAVNTITNSISETSIPLLLKNLNISERQLERKFKMNLGLSPKQFLRVTRFEKTVEQLQDNNSLKLSNLAYDMNYTDPSHFNKEFKEFSSFTPKVFINQSKLLEESSSMVLQDIED